jgi:hypothetical protein
MLGFTLFHLTYKSTPRGCCRSRSVRDRALEPAEAVGVGVVCEASVKQMGVGAGGGAACEVEAGDVGYC